MIPPNLKHEEVGMFLVAVGEHMYISNLAAGAVLDGLSKDTLIDAMQNCEPCLELARAEELLQLTLEEAINFNEMDLT